MNQELVGTITTTGGEVETAFVPKCSHCKHAAVCKFKKEYKKLLSSIEETYNEYKNSDIFKINLQLKALHDVGQNDPLNEVRLSSPFLQDFLIKDVPILHRFINFFPTSIDLSL